VSAHPLQTAGMDRKERELWFQRNRRSYLDRDGIVPSHFICQGALGSKLRRDSHNDELGEFYHQGHYSGGKEWTAC
jgi:hypothetical protein